MAYTVMALASYGTQGKPLFFRGKRILDAIIETLARDHGLTHAHDVLLTGCRQAHYIVTAWAHIGMALYSYGPL